MKTQSDAPFDPTDATKLWFVKSGGRVYFFDDEADATDTAETLWNETRKGVQVWGVDVANVTEFKFEIPRPQLREVTPAERANDHALITLTAIGSLDGEVAQAAEIASGADRVGYLTGSEIEHYRERIVTFIADTAADLDALDYNALTDENRATVDTQRAKLDEIRGHLLVIGERATPQP